MMETSANTAMQTARKTHPLILIAATSVTLVSLAGVASLAGWLPGNASAPPAPVAQVAMAAQAAPAVTPEKTATANAPAAASSTVRSNDTHSAPRRTTAPRPAAAPVATRTENSERSYSDDNAPSGNRNTTKVAAYPANDSGIYAENSRQAPAVCRDCGTVEGIREIAQEGQGTGLGAVAGTVLGGILGHQVGNGRGRDVATVVGALGGAYAGHTVEKNARGSSQYEISVRLDDGSVRKITETQQPVWHTGDRVRVSNNHIASL